MRRATVGQVLAAAPDEASRRAARRLAIPGPWFDAGCDDRVAWGSCRGSARAPYQVACDLGSFGVRCTCPSRKQPCKHALALLLLWAAGSVALPAGRPPSDVAAWIAGRPADGPGIAESLPADPDGPVGGADPGPEPGVVTDPEAAARRAAARAERIAAGMAELQLWLADLLRHGLGWAQTQDYPFWDDTAARMVDAQAPAVAGRVRAMFHVVRSGAGWPTRLLAEVARLHLLAAGWARYDELPEAGRADLRTAAGWPWPSDQVLAGPRETDSWYVLARAASDEEQIRVQRTWLWGRRTGRPALLLDFARPGAAFAWELWPGEAMEAAVARFPGSAALRVLVAERLGDPAPAGPPPGWASLADLARARAGAASRDPFLDRWPVSVRDVVPVCTGGGADRRWVLTDRSGASLDLEVEEAAAWRLMAVSGGAPLQVLGEWAGEAVTPLGAWVEDRMVSL